MAHWVLRELNVGVTSYRVGFYEVLRVTSGQLLRPPSRLTPFTESGYIVNVYSGPVVLSYWRRER